jgi:signal transduction histidine kinase
MNISWLERFTLEKTIRGLCEDMKKMTHLNLEYNAPDEFPLMPMETKIHIFRIVQELLSNAVKYAADAKIILEISFVDSTFTLEYSDDGPGFIKDKDFRNGVGLSNLSERIKLVNGKMETDTNPGFGTYYLIKIPLPKDKIAD